jgi:hypothetical protein
MKKMVVVMIHLPQNQKSPWTQVANSEVWGWNKLDSALRIVHSPKSQLE